MKKFLLVASLLALTACTEEGYVISPQPDYELAPRQYTCTAPEAARVHHESKFCNDNTSFFSSYCYGTAIMRICTKKTK